MQSVTESPCCRSLCAWCACDPCASSLRVVDDPALAVQLSNLTDVFLSNEPYGVQSALTEAFNARAVRQKQDQLEAAGVISPA